MKLSIYIAAFFVCLSLSLKANAYCSAGSIYVEDTLRTGIVCNRHLGRDENNPVPLLLVFHGRDSSGLDMLYATHFEEELPNAMVVYLDGLVGNPGIVDQFGLYTGWNTYVDLDDVNQADVAFVDAVIDGMSQAYNIDMDKIYAVGHSNGAVFLRTLWLMRADTFAGFAFSAAQADGMITFATPLPVFMGMGLLDDLAPFEWQNRSIEYAVERFGIESEISYDVGTELYQNEEGVELMTYIHPDGHIWPADQTQKIAEFFRQQHY